MSIKCPTCTTLNDDNEWRCGGCGSILKNEKLLIQNPLENFKTQFSIKSYFINNFHLFTIIGVIGTMIALLPNLGEKIIGIGWLKTDFNFIPSIFIPLIFSMFIFAGGLLLFIIFFVLIQNIWENKYDNEILQRIALTIILLLMMFGSFYFILTIISLIPNYHVRFYSIIIFFGFITVYTIYSYFNLFTHAVQLVKSSLDEGYDFLNIIGWSAFILIILGCLTYVIAIPVSDYFIHPTDPHDVIILTDQEIYSPLISTTTGLELYPTNSTNFKSFYPNYNTTGFRWETNYGFFVTRDEYTSRTILLDNYTVRHNSDKVFWSYSESDIPQDRSPVIITLKIYRADGWDWVPLINTSINLNWTDQNFARVDDFTNHSIGYWYRYHPFMISE